MKVLLQSGKTNFIRWGKFNLVGAMGMIVQLGVLALLNQRWPGHFLAATAAAIELTLIHNFIWHLHTTWRDRLPTRKGENAFGMRQLEIRIKLAGQFVRFHLSNGLVSIAGNLALMPSLMRGMRLPVVAANAIAILCCSLVNFWLGDSWAFAAETQTVETAGEGGQFLRNLPQKLLPAQLVPHDKRHRLQDA